MSTTATPYAFAMLSSADGEHKEPLDGRLESGEVPDWLSGSLIRNGPALFEVGETSYNHFFDGLAMLQKFSFESGRVTYTSQFIRSDTYEANMAKQRIVVSEFGTAAYDDPCKSLLGKFASFFYTPEEEKKLKEMTTDNTLVNVFPIGDQLFAATETPRMNRIDPRSLDRVGKRDFSELVTVNTVTAHPHFDNEGNVLNLGTAYREKSGPSYVVVRIPDGDLDRTEVVARIPATWKWHPSYYHSFAITQSYVILVESPLCLSVPRLILAEKLGKKFDDALRWYDGYDCLIHVVDRQSGAPVQTFKSPAFFTFHHMNAYEGEEGEIVMDVCAYETGEIVHSLTLKEMQKLNQLPDNQLHLRRYRMRVGSDQPATFTAPEGQLALEFPTINYRFNGIRYRYGYGVGECKAKPSPNSQIVKIDWDTMETLVWQEELCEPSEAIFVERPDAKSEDDGVLLSSVIKIGDNSRSLFLLILNAIDMSEVARIAFDKVSVPRDIHGMFFSERLLQRLEVK